jgi:hypothetical protein
MTFFTKEKTVREKIQDDINRLEKYLQLNDSKILCAVFDVGTKGVRVIVGPKMKINEFRLWDPDRTNLFYTASLNAKLGDEFEKNFGTLNTDSKSLQETILFLSSIRKKLQFIPIENFAIVGTAVFRWLENRLEVLEHIRINTNLPTIKILTEAEEAYYSLLAVTHTHDKIAANNFPKKTFTNDGAILLFDQGGGSTEISYLFPSIPDSIELTSIYHIGSTNLENKFVKYRFRYEHYHPEVPKMSIEVSLQQAEYYIEGNIQRLNGFEKILPLNSVSASKPNISAFGMGTAIKICFEQYFGSYASKFRGWTMTINDIVAVYNKIKNELITKYGFIEALYNKIPRPGHTNAEFLDFKITMLYSLKAYELLLRKFGIDTISYSYYNLKYGIYLEMFVEGIKKNSLRLNDIYTPQQNKITAKQRINLLNDLVPGHKDASDFHQFSMDSLTFIFGKRLSNPVKEKKIDDGRGRIDIVYDNVDNRGFFARLNSHYKIMCPKIHVECKNNSNLNNANLNQIFSRLSKNKGNFGIIVCRFKANYETVKAACRTELLKSDKAVIVLDDSDIKSLLIKKEFGNEKAIDELMTEKFDELIM